MKEPGRSGNQSGGNKMNAEVLADELNLPSEVARKLRGKRLAIIEVKDGVLLKPIGDPIAEARGCLKGRFDTVRLMQYKEIEKSLEK